MTKIFSLGIAAMSAVFTFPVFGEEIETGAHAPAESDSGNRVGAANTVPGDSVDDEMTDEDRSDLDSRSAQVTVQSPSSGRHLHIVTAPPRMRLRLDGERMGLTPTVESLDEEAHEVSLFRVGFELTRTTIPPGSDDVHLQVQGSRPVFEAGLALMNIGSIAATGLLLPFVIENEDIFPIPGASMAFLIAGALMMGLDDHREEEVSIVRGSPASADSSAEEERERRFGVVLRLSLSYIPLPNYKELLPMVGAGFLWRFPRFQLRLLTEVAYVIQIDNAVDPKGFSFLTLGLYFPLPWSYVSGEVGFGAAHFHDVLAFFHAGLGAGLRFGSFSVGPSVRSYLGQEHWSGDIFALAVQLDIELVW